MSKAYVKMGEPPTSSGSFINIYNAPPVVLDITKLVGFPGIEASTVVNRTGSLALPTSPSLLIASTVAL